MTDHDYRTGLKAYANSDLSELAGILNPAKRMKASPATLAFGTAFHTAILEPDKYAEIAETISPDASLTLLDMFRSFHYFEKELVALINNSQREQVRQWSCPITNLPLKAKIDASVMPRHVHLIDLKTTSCTSKDKFIDTLTRYDYDRQAAFYLSSDPDARYFEFVGVQKQPPYQVFRCAFHVTDPFIVGGQRKMRYLLAMAKEEAGKANGWVPSSWSRIQQSTQYGLEQNRR